MRKATLGDVHAETATSLNNLALELWDRGRPDEAAVYRAKLDALSDGA